MLTKAHVPPRAAFNAGNFRWGGTTSDSRLSYGRPQLGGANRPAHCQSCRARTSPWDDEYIRWAHCFAGNLVGSQWKGERTQIVGELNGVRPGRFIRAAIAGMTALTPNLIDSHPELVRMVRDGTPGEAPSGIRFLAAIAPNGSRAHLEGNHGGVLVHLARNNVGGEWDETTAPSLSSVIHFAPFSLLLADRQLVDSYPHVDCTEWLQLGVEELANVSLVLPVIDLPSAPDSPVPISMMRFEEARA